MDEVLFLFCFNQCWVEGVWSFIVNVEMECFNLLFYEVFIVLVNWYGDLLCKNYFGFENCIKGQLFWFFFKVYELGDLKKMVEDYFSYWIVVECYFDVFVEVVKVFGIGVLFDFLNDYLFFMINDFVLEVVACQLFGID